MQDINRGDLEENLNVFEAAVSAKHTELAKAEVHRILIAIDGSNQDDATLRAAVELMSRTGAAARIVFAHPEGLNREREQLLMRHAGVAHAEAVRTEAGPAWRQILDAAVEVKADVIAVCAPYLEDYDELAGATAGTNVDMLISRRKQAVLVIREPWDDMAAAFQRMTAPLRLGDWRTPRAGAWATSLARPGDEVTLVAVADEDFLQNLGDVREDLRLEDIDEDRVAGLVRPDIAGLIAAIQRRASEARFQCRVLVRPGPAVQAVASFANEGRGLIVASCPGDCAVTGYAQIQGLVRAARAPLLLV